MLFNYLKLSFRLLMRNPFFTFINVAGLSVGFSVFFILWQYSQSELKSDQFHKDYERIVRICNTWTYKDSDGNPDMAHRSGFDPEVARLVANDFAEIEEYTRVLIQWNFEKDYLRYHDIGIFFRYDKGDGTDKSFAEQKVAYGDSNLFHFFYFPLVKGDAKSVLREANSIALSESVAKKYFGDEDPIGKILQLNGQTPFQVTGVFKDLPINGHLDFDIVLSSRTIEKVISKVSFGEFYSYFKIRKGVDVPGLEKKVDAAALNYYLPALSQIGITEIPQVTFFFQELKDVVFPDLTWNGTWGDNGFYKPQQLLYIFELISVVILAMAWINYINLGISFNRKRMKELAARKSVGARSRDFISQFILDSALINLLSAAVGITLVQMMKQPARLLFDFYVPEWADISTSTILILIGTIVAGVVVTGGYPAVVTIRQSPKVLFGTWQRKSDSSSLGHVLTTLQFTFAVTLIVWVFAVASQISFILKKDLGFRRDSVALVAMPLVLPDNWRTQAASLEKELTTTPGVVDVTFSFTTPGDNATFVTLFRDGNTIQSEINGGVDESFIPLFNIPLLAGRNFSADNPADENAILVSRKSCAQLGYSSPQDAIGAEVYLFTSPKDRTAVEIIGVFEDYASNALFSGNFKTTRGNMLTYGGHLFYWLSPPNRTSILLEAGNFQQTMVEIEKLYHQAFPGNVFEWTTLNDHLSKAYSKEAVSRNQLVLFTCLAIGIACLGLLGQMANKVVEKTKEIGIRKVLGAELRQIGQLLVNANLKQIAIAGVAGTPIAWYLVQQYLQKFTERVDLQWWHYLTPILILVSIMFSTIAPNLWKAWTSNPVEALKYE